jgi:hypothetical protein
VVRGKDPWESRYKRRLWRQSNRDWITVVVFVAALAAIVASIVVLFH